MTSSTRIQRKYDHRLRELVRTTGDIEQAIQRGVPRSTARGWLKATPTDVVTLDVLDMDSLPLQQEVLNLQSRLNRLLALLRLLVVVLKVSNVSLANMRFPKGTEKRRLLRAIERSCSVIPLRIVLGILRLSPSRYHAWKREDECGLDQPEQDVPKLRSAHVNRRLSRNTLSYDSLVGRTWKATRISPLNPDRRQKNRQETQASLPGSPWPRHSQTSSGENSRGKVQNVVTNCWAS